MIRSLQTRKAYQLIAAGMAGVALEEMANVCTIHVARHNVRYRWFQRTFADDYTPRRIEVCAETGTPHVFDDPRQLVIVCAPARVEVPVE